MPQCQELDLQMELLDAVTRDEAPTRDAALHLAACAACQTAIERLHRMTSMWVADQPDEQTLTAAVTRFQASRQTQRPSSVWRTPFASALMGAVLGMAVLVVSGRSGDPARTVAAPSSSILAAKSELSTPSRAAIAAPHIQRHGGAVTPLTDGLRVELQPGESARVALGDGHTSELSGPCLVQFWASPTEVGGWRLSIERPTASSRADLDPGNDSVDVAEAKNAPADPSLAHARPPTVQVPEPNAPAGGKADVVYERAWARAAEALRKDDFDGADRAFNELCGAPDAATRDAARLARAQLWIAHGRGAAVRPVLQNLATTGATALVRERAAEFLGPERH